MKILIDTKEITSYILVYLMIFTSGTLLYNNSNQDLILGSSALISGLAWWVYSNRHINIQFIMYLSTYVAFVLIVSAYTHGGITATSIIAQVIKFLFVYFVIATANEKFLEVYTKLIVFLASISIIGYISDQLSLLNGLLQLLPYHPSIGPGGRSYGYEGFLYMFRFNEHLPRNNSIFFEPGAYQFFINSALYILFFCNLSLKRRTRLISLGILLVTIGTTQSTTGYLATSIIMLGGFLYSRPISNKIKLSAIVIGTLTLILLAPVIEGVVFGKLEHYSSIESIRDQSNLRSYGLLVDKEIIKKYPLGLGYEGYFRAFSTIGKITLGRGSSNGITKLIGIMGIPFAIFYLGSMLWGFFIYNKNTAVAFIGFTGVILFLYSESYFIFSPIIVALITGMFLVKHEKNTL